MNEEDVANFDAAAALRGPGWNALQRAVNALGHSVTSPDELVLEKLKEGAGNPTSVGVWRVSSAAGWSLVVKVLTLPSDTLLPHDIPEALNFWRREVEVFESGITADLPDPLVSVGYFGSAEIEPGTAALFLEDLGRIERTDWSLDWYREAVAGFGAWQAGYLAGRPLPNHWWLNHDVTRRWHALTRTYSDGYMALALAGDPRLRRLTPQGCDPDFRPLFELVVNPGPLLTAMDQQVPVLCHNDANIDNLVIRLASGATSIVLFDLQWLGTAGVGTELGQLLCQIPATLEGQSRADIDEEMLDLYYDAVGAKAVGIPREVIEFNYCASGAIRQFCFAVALESIPVNEFLASGDDAGLEAHIDEFITNNRGGALPRLAARAYELLPRMV